MNNSLGDYLPDYSNVPFSIRRLDTRDHISFSDVEPTVFPFVSFLYVVSGEVLTEIDGNQYMCSAGNLLIIPEHHYFYIRYYSDAIGYVGMFRPSMLSRPMRVLKLVEPLYQSFPNDEATFMGEMFNMMIKNIEKENFFFLSKGLDLLLSLIKSQPTNDLPNHVTNFLESVFSPTKPLRSLAEYADERFVSPGHLNRMVKDATGKSVGAWIDIARLSMARRMLGDTDMPIAEISTAVGLDDPSYFSRFFKHHTGVTPNEYRKKMHGLS